MQFAWGEVGEDCGYWRETGVLLRLAPLYDSADCLNWEAAIRKASQFSQCFVFLPCHS